MSNHIKIITHRGLEPSNPFFPPESSLEAFKSHIDRGFGIEFDPNFTKSQILISHHKLPDPSSPSLSQILSLIRAGNSLATNALHLKGKFQETGYVNRLLEQLKDFTDILPRMLIFDVKPETAEYIKGKLPQAVLAPSVAHPYDIERYNGAVLGTLISIDEAIKHKGLYDWVWLDEWDLAGPKDTSKKFYTDETFSRLRAVGYKIALVTPELHGTSPGLLGGEAHPDAKPQERLMARIKEIIDLSPDALCTDYPEEVKNLFPIL